MVFNSAIRYQKRHLTIDAILAEQIAKQHGTPCYVYSRTRILENYNRLVHAFSGLDAHIHYSVKANGNLTILKTLLEAGAGMDVVSGGEIYRVLQAGGSPEHIVFAGVGKSKSEIRYAIEQGVGWFNVENVLECQYINGIASELGVESVSVALRLNPEVTANTHPYIATGHGGAKFGLTEGVIRAILEDQAKYPHIRFEGLHIHIGSQLLDVESTRKALEKVIEIARTYPSISTLNIGGGIPVVYRPDDPLPDIDAFAQQIEPLLRGFRVFMEPGRSIIADAGVLLTEVLYVKEQAGQRFVIVDASMTDLIRPALYQAHHEIVPLVEAQSEALTPAQVVGPVCETADVLGRDVLLPTVKPGDLLAIMTAGAYGMVMANQYNARPRPVEIMVSGDEMMVIREREMWDSLTVGE